MDYTCQYKDIFCANAYLSSNKFADLVNIPYYWDVHFLFLMGVIRYSFFVAGFLGTILIIILAGRSHVFGFDRFKIWTAQQNIQLGQGQYVPATRSDETPVAAALANMQIGNGEYYTTPEIDTVFRLLKEQRALLSVDIMSLLKQDTASNAKTLQAHIRHLELVTQKTKQHSDQLLERAQRLLEESTTCLSAKRVGDQQFFAGVQSRNDGDTQQWLMQSLEYAPCYIAKRIEANASSYLASYVAVAQPYLQQRYTILSTNVEKILAYNGLFEGNILDELQTIKQQVLLINRASNLSPEQLDSVFNFWKFDENTKLPTYNANTIFFPDGKIPTYANPGIELRTNQID